MVDQQKTYKDKDWDTYRNHSIGFIFQQYNLIPHLTLVENVELALTIAGLTSKEKRKMSEDALAIVGLKGVEKKLPNQLSGGQQQRVAIARAIVNNPDIILADEPTGALDSDTSVQVMEILKKISKTKLVIMVTHNDELCKEYSDRIIRMKDGLIVDDTASIEAKEEKPEIDDKKKPSMGFWTAIKLSFKNLVSKWGRTLTTGLAGSIGIVGIALILAFSTGTTAYMNDLLNDAINTTPIKISQLGLNANAVSDMSSSTSKGDLFPDSSDGIIPYQPEGSMFDVNNITKDYVDYVEKLADPESDVHYATAVQKEMDMPLKLFYNATEGPKMVDTDVIVYTEELPNRYDPEVPSLIEAHYDNLSQDLPGSHFPVEKNEIALVVDNRSNINVNILTALGINYKDSNGNVLNKLPYEDIIGKEYKLFLNNAYYEKNNIGIERFEGIKDPTKISNYINNPDEEGKTLTLKITAVIRQKKKDVPSMILLPGIGYSSKLVDYMLEENKNSEIVQYQINNRNINVFTGLPFSDNPDINKMQYQGNINKLGYGKDSVPKSIYIYAQDQESKEHIVDYLNSWNDDPLHKTHQITYFDSLEITSIMLNDIMQLVTIVLACFSGISLIVSSVMIGIITYVSVIERTKEIGVLRALGASKTNIREVFNAETVIIGFLAGLLGVSVAYILQIIINIIFKATLGIWGVCHLRIIDALLLIIISTALTSIAGLIPSNKAAKKDPVLCLRSE